MVTTETPARGERLMRPAVIALLAGLLALALGTILVILGVNAAGLLMPGVYILDLALVLVAAAGVLRALARDA